MNGKCVTELLAGEGDTLSETQLAAEGKATMNTVNDAQCVSR